MKEIAMTQQDILDAYPDEVFLLLTAWTMQF